MSFFAFYYRLGIGNIEPHSLGIIRLQIKEKPFKGHSTVSRIHLFVKHKKGNYRLLR